MSSVWVIFLLLACSVVVRCADIAGSFDRWLDQHGAQRLVRTRDYRSAGMGFGFEATRALEVGDIALSIPLKLLISETNVLNISSPYAAVGEWAFPEEPFVVFWLYEAVVRQKQSFYAPYIALMSCSLRCPNPTPNPWWHWLEAEGSTSDCSNPLYWTPDELPRHFQASFMVADTLLLNATLMQYFIHTRDQVIAPLAAKTGLEPQMISFQDFVWAFFLKRSRTWKLPFQTTPVHSFASLRESLSHELGVPVSQFQAPWTDRDELLGNITNAHGVTFLPGIDVFNHDSARPNVILRRISPYLYAHAIVQSKVAAGDQVWISYVPSTTLSNAETITAFNFCSDPLEFFALSLKNQSSVIDTATAYISSPRSHVDYVDRAVGSVPVRLVLPSYMLTLAALFADAGINIDDFKFHISPSDVQFNGFLRALRLLDLSSTHDIRSPANCIVRLLRFEPISLPNELAALRRGLELIDSLLSAYSDDIDHDVRLLFEHRLSRMIERLSPVHSCPAPSLDSPSLPYSACDILSKLATLDGRALLGLQLRLSERLALRSVAERLRQHWLAILKNGDLRSEPFGQIPGSRVNVQRAGEDVCAS